MHRIEHNPSPFLFDKSWQSPESDAYFTHRSSKVAVPRSTVRTPESSYVNELLRAAYSRSPSPVPNPNHYTKYSCATHEKPLGVPHMRMILPEFDARPNLMKPQLDWSPQGFIGEAAYRDPHVIKKTASNPGLMGTLSSSTGGPRMIPRLPLYDPMGSRAYAKSNYRIPENLVRPELTMPSRLPGRDSEKLSKTRLFPSDRKFQNEFPRSFPRPIWPSDDESIGSHHFDRFHFRPQKRHDFQRPDRTLIPTRPFPGDTTQFDYRGEIRNEYNFKSRTSRHEIPTRMLPDLRKKTSNVLVSHIDSSRFAKSASSGFRRAKGQLIEAPRYHSERIEHYEGCSNGHECSSGQGSDCLSESDHTNYPPYDELARRRYLENSFKYPYNSPLNRSGRYKVKQMRTPPTCDTISNLKYDPAYNSIFGEDSLSSDSAHLRESARFDYTKCVERGPARRSPPRVPSWYRSSGKIKDISLRQAGTSPFSGITDRSDTSISGVTEAYNKNYHQHPDPYKTATSYDLWRMPRYAALETESEFDSLEDAGCPSPQPENQYQRLPDCYSKTKPASKITQKSEAMYSKSWNQRVNDVPQHVEVWDTFDKLNRTNEDESSDSMFDLEFSPNLKHCFRHFDREKKSRHEKKPVFNMSDHLPPARGFVSGRVSEEGSAYQNLSFVVQAGTSIPASRYSLSSNHSGESPALFDNHLELRRGQDPTEGHAKSESGTPGPKQFQLADISIQFSFEEIEEATNGFAVEFQLGEGANGRVYKGELRSGTFVAVKVMKFANKACGFEEEVRALSVFRHPNLVTLLGFGIKDRTCMLVYEYLDAGDLCLLLHRGCPTPYSEPLDPKTSTNLPWTIRLSVALDAACGLSYLHSRTPKLFHRDIKTSNILLCSNGDAKLADFGLSAKSNHATPDKLFVASAEGTPGYADPAYVDSLEVTTASETYSFGMVLLELLTGRAPALYVRDKLNPEGPFVLEYIRGMLSRSTLDVLLQSWVDWRAGWPLQVGAMMGRLIFACTDPVEARRPSMTDVVDGLRSILTSISAQRLQRDWRRLIRSLGIMPKKLDKLQSDSDEKSTETCESNCSSSWKELKPNSPLLPPLRKMTRGSNLDPLEINGDNLSDGDSSPSPAYSANKRFESCNFVQADSHEDDTI